jgi:hypothetical protein
MFGFGFIRSDDDRDDGKRKAQAHGNGKTEGEDRLQRRVGKSEGEAERAWRTRRA